MKKIYCLLLVLFIGTYCHAQGPATDNDETPQIESYILLTDAPVYECDIEGHLLGTVQAAPAFCKFTYIGKRDTFYIVKFWVWNDSIKKQKFNATESGDAKYFLIAADVLKERAKTYHRLSFLPGITAGTAIVPIKMRFGDFDFSKDFTIGSTVGASWRISHNHESYVSLLIGFGVTSVTVDTVDHAAITPTLGLVFEFPKNIQLGIFTGWDFISKNDLPEWDYQGKTWLSVGIGYTILSKQAKTSQTLRPPRQ